MPVHTATLPRGLRGLTRKKRLALILLFTPIAILLLFLLLDRLSPFPWQALDRPPAVVIADREGEPLRFLLPEDGRWRLPVRLQDLPPELPRALVASEDQRFWHHPGVDPLAILRAGWADLRARAVISGGSTIPMQIARMAEPRRRNLASKVRESFRALQLTRRYSKKRLLEIYLNLLPYGGNVEGVGAAAWFYFGKSPERLSLGEIALLTALPRSPLRYDPTTGLRGQTAARAARDRVLAQLSARGAFPAGEIAAAQRQPIPAVRRRPPFAAPHWCELIAARLGPHPSLQGSARLRTSLDRRLQRTAEEQVARRAAELASEGIGNAAVVVIENRTRAVRALVGSANFFDRRHQGQVNGATARRSPGSTLKPFLYGMALDQGRLLPDSYVLDVPTDYSGYVPENYDGQYHGRVTVREALVHSLNAPAVRLLSEVGLADFHKLLLRGGLETLDRPSARYGLPLILGAGEVTLLDLANLYATLAQGGLYEPYRTLEEGPELPHLRQRGRHSSPSRPKAEPASDRLLSPEAAWAITGILTDLRRPDLPDAWDIARDVPAVAWKTGTSYGHRDAWAVGWSGRYTIGVWVGNFDARPVQGISGSQHAGPLLFDLFRAIERNIGGGGGAEGPRKPLGVEPEEIEVCAESHELPGPYCPTRIRVPYLPGRSKLSACSYHRQVLVDTQTGDLLSGDCVTARAHRFRVLTVYPPELAAWWRSQGNHVDDLPRLAAGCQGIPSGEAPKIVSPDAATAYRLRKDAPPEFQRIPLVARAGPGATHLFWYQDGLLVATNTPEEKLFLPPARGTHRLVVTDDLGRSDGVTYKVE
ncbi:MAG: penicillin-binding protein [Acidobacteriota bacterium]|nr:penicillin-binding protein [Acidobacteriota bacterium]